MSRRKSRLSQRRPIRSTAELAADRDKYRLRDDLILRLVTHSARQGRACRITLECGHEFLVTATEDRVLWPDEVPMYIDCTACLERLESALGITPPTAGSD